MRALNQALNDFKILGLSVGHIAVIAALIVSAMTIKNNVESDLDAKVRVHNETSVDLHPHLQKEIDALESKDKELVIADRELLTAVKRVEDNQNNNTKIIVDELRRLANGK